MSVPSQFDMFSVLFWAGLQSNWHFTYKVKPTDVQLNPTLTLTFNYNI